MKRCDHCGKSARRAITPYWQPMQRICAKCCLSLSERFDKTTWPKPGDEVPT